MSPIATKKSIFFQVWTIEEGLWCLENILHTIFLKLRPFRLDISEAFVEVRQFRSLINNTTRGKFLLQFRSHFSRHIFFVFLIELCNVACFCSSEGSVTELLNTGVAQRNSGILMSRISEGRVKLSPVQAWSDFIFFFSLSIRCVSRSEKHLARFLGHFSFVKHFRNLYTIQPTFSLPFAFCVFPRQ